jgi:hypothetical protein
VIVVTAQVDKLCDVQHTRDVLGEVAVNDGLDVVAVVEVRKVKRVWRLCRPETHRVDSAVAVSATRKKQVQKDGEKEQTKKRERAQTASMHMIAVSRP